MTALHPDAGGVETLGGYRIIRKLGSGERADIFLGHASQGVGEKAQLVAVKVFRAEASRPSIDREIEALANIEIPHIVRLQDLASRPSGEPVLILQRLNPAGLDRLLSDRKKLEAGEVVTVLAPIAIALGELHRCGFVHGGLTASKVLLDDAGAPMMVGLGQANPIGGRIEGGTTSMTPAMLEAEPQVAMDLDRLSALTRAVVFQIANMESHAGSQDLLRWLDDVPLLRESGTFTAELAERLFALADAVPIRLVTTGGADDAPARIPHRQWVSETSETARRGSEPDSEAKSLGPVSLSGSHEARSELGIFTFLSLLPLSGGLERALRELVGFLQSPVKKILGSLRRVRKPVWLAAGVGVIAFVAAALLAQSPMEQPVPEKTESPASASSLLGRSENTVTEDAIDGTDPVAAAEMLLTLRQKCFTDRSVLCLDGVDQQNSAAWDTDQRRIRELQQGSEFVDDLSPDEYSLALLDRLGDTALIAMEVAAKSPGDGVEAIPGAQNAPASVLIIKTEAGWRIRGLLSDPR